MKKIYAFDFDGTLTKRDTLLAFIRYAKGPWALAMGLLRYAHLLVMMKLGCYPNWKVKQKVFAHFFKGLELDTFNRLCRDFAYDKHHLLRDKGIEAIEDALYNDIEVYIVSASIDNWVREFFSNERIHIIGTKIEVENSRLTGRFLTKNCYGQEKVNRLLTQEPNRQDYHLTAYGDSRGDKEMLAFADESYFKPFR